MILNQRTKFGKLASTFEIVI